MRDDQKRALLADGGKSEAAQNVMNIPLDAAATMADYAPQAECAPRVDADTATCQNCNGIGSHGGRFHIDDKGSSEYEPYKCDVCDGFGRVSADAGKDAAPVAWRYFDGEGNYEYRDDAPSESSIYHAAIYGRKYEPLYAAPQAECAPREAQPVAQWLRDLRRAHEYLDKGKPFFTGKDCAELADLIESIAAPTPERAQESAGVRLTPEQSGAIQIAISILTPEYLLTANRLRSIVATIDAELAKKEGA